jgi:hypothetical protein
VSRNYIVTSAPRVVTTADTAVPSTPDAQTMPAGVYSTAGASMLRIDIAAPVTTTGSYTLNIYGWNGVLKAWISEGQAVVTAAAVGDLGPGTRLFSSVIVTNWCRPYVAVMVQTMATNGGSGVGTSITVASCIQDT